MRIVGLTLGSVVVYLAVACASAVGSSIENSKNEADGSLLTAPSDGSSMIDSFLLPTEAQAAATPEVVTEPCDKKNPLGGNYAEHAYPGATQAELAHVVVLLGPSPVAPPGFTHAVGSVWAKDGAVATSCPASQSAIFVR